MVKPDSRDLFRSIGEIYKAIIYKTEIEKANDFLKCLPSLKAIKIKLTKAHNMSLKVFD